MSLKIVLEARKPFGERKQWRWQLMMGEYMMDGKGEGDNPEECIAAAIEYQKSVLVREKEYKDIEVAELEDKIKSLTEITY